MTSDRHKNKINFWTNNAMPVPAPRIKSDIWLWPHFEPSFQYGFRITIIFFDSLKIEMNVHMFLLRIHLNRTMWWMLMNCSQCSSYCRVHFFSLLLSNTFFHIKHFVVDFFVPFFLIQTTTCKLFKWECVARASAV